MKKGTPIYWDFNGLPMGQFKFPQYGEGKIYRLLSKAAQGFDYEVEVAYPDHLRGQRYCFKRHEVHEVVELPDA